MKGKRFLSLLLCLVMVLGKMDSLLVVMIFCFFAGVSFWGTGAVRGTGVAGVGDASLLQRGMCDAALSGRSFFAS